MNTTYFRAPEAHPETQDRVDNLEDLEDIVPSLVEEVRALRRMVDRERQRTRRLENEVRDMGRRQQGYEELADEAGDEAEMDDDGDGEVQKRQEGETPVRKPFDVDEFLEEQRARELACRMIQRSMINRTRCSSGHPNDGILDGPQNVSNVYGIRGGEVTILDDEEALEAAAASALPPSPEEDSTSSRDEPRILTQAVRAGGNGVNGFVDHEGVEDLSEDVWIREPDSEYQNGDSRGSGRSTNDNRNGTTNTFHINAGIVTPNNTSHNGAPLTNGRSHTSNAYIQPPTPERVTADPEDIRPRPRLSTPELNEAIGDWGSVSYTLDGPILRLRAIRAEGGIDQEIPLRPHQATEARTNGYATATQIIPPSIYLRNDTRNSSESSTRSSRSASLSGTTLVNSAVGSTNGDTVPTSNPPTNGELSESVELHRNGAYETPTATLRRRRDARDMRRAARENLLVERGSVEEESTGSSEGGSEGMMDAEIAEVEEMWREIRRQRGTMEEEMMRHVAARERAAQAQQTNGAGTNGVESEGDDEASGGSGSETRERRLDSE
ncbi:hypothetical protein J4E81_002073 [Alternaria sp. BMP 2799]|nr:hypothetical protein J4E81_002073 [Alternaria sp. BMP 2799]